MARMEFRDLRFEEQADESVKIIFLDNYYSFILRSDLQRIGCSKIGKNFLEFDVGEKSAATKFNLLLSRSFSQLKNSVTGRKTAYIHMNSGIPLIGSNEFGIADRDTNWLELKPNTGCNLDCVFCSINESGNKRYDYVVEKDYLVQEANKIIKLKHGKVNIHIGPQGEPLLYRDLVSLVADMRKNPKVDNITCVTNGCLLSKGLIDELADAGLSRLNISLHSVDPAKASGLSQRVYPAEKIIEMIGYASSKFNVVIVPLIVPGITDNEADGLIALAKKTYPQHPLIGFQNFLEYPKGKKPAKQRSFDDFFSILKKLEEKHGVPLVNSDLGVEFHKDMVLQRPFKKDEIVGAVVALPGRYSDEMAAVAKDRCITIVDFDNDEKKVGRKIKAKILRTKHNIFKASAVRSERR